jgi:hypothetical protein
MANERLPRSGILYFKPPQDKVEMQQLWRVMDDLQSGLISVNEAIGALVLAGIVSSVTDDGNGVVVVDNTDPLNPIITFAGVYVDGVSITGNGTSGNPLVATATGGGETLSPLLLMGG